MRSVTRRRTSDTHTGHKLASGPNQTAEPDMDQAHVWSHLTGCTLRGHEMPEIDLAIRGFVAESPDIAPTECQDGYGRSFKCAQSMRPCQGHASGHKESHQLAHAKEPTRMSASALKVCVTLPYLRKIYHLQGCPPVVAPSRMEHKRLGILERLSSG